MFLAVPFAAGMNGHIAKPIDIEILFSTFLRHFTGSRDLEPFSCF